MAPPSALSPEPATNGDSKPSTAAIHEPGLSESKAKVQMPKFPVRLSFKSLHPTVLSEVSRDTSWEQQPGFGLFDMSSIPFLPERCADFGNL